MSALVELQGVARSFGPVPVLNGISLSTEPGEVVAIYGRSGSGKTTLLNLIGGLDRPTSGVVRVAGLDLNALAAGALTRLRRTRIGFIFQSYGLLSHLTALENVLFALQLAGWARGQRLGRAEAVLDAVGLTPRMHHRPAELSGGERQRVAVARALASRPQLILADEPTGALDSATGLAVVDLLAGFAREGGANVWIVTHDSSIRERVDRAYRIQNGLLVTEPPGVRA